MIVEPVGGAGYDYPTLIGQTLSPTHPRSFLRFLTLRVYLSFEGIAGAKRGKPGGGRGIE